jgi:hypothetical protein
VKIKIFGCSEIFIVTKNGKYKYKKSPNKWAS